MEENIEQPIEEVQVLEHVPVENVANEEINNEEEVIQEEVKAEEKPEPIPKGVQKRIDRAVKEKYEAQARTKMLEERLNQLEQRQQPQQQVQQQVHQGEPKLDDYQSYEDFIAAKAEYIADARVNNTLQEAQRRNAVEREQYSRQQAVEAFNSRVATATAELPDFEEVIADSNIPMPVHIEQAIYDSDVGPHLAYYLATHPDEAIAISKQHPISAVRSLGRIEEKISNGSFKKAQKSEAPAPISPAGTKTKITKNPSEMSQEEFNKWRQGYIKKR